MIIISKITVSWPTTGLSSGACEAKKSDDDYKSADVRSISSPDSKSEKQQLGK